MAYNRIAATYMHMYGVDEATDTLLHTDIMNDLDMQQLEREKGNGAYIGVCTCTYNNSLQGFCFEAAAKCPEPG